MRYLDADTIADARNAWGCGVPLDKIAGHVGITVSELRAALKLPPLKREPMKAANSEFDLWSVDRLDGVL